MRPLVITARRSPPRRSRAIRVAPPPANTLAVNQSAAGFYRVADLTLARYELYVGTDASPDFSGSPAQTSTSLPITTAALPAGHVYHLVLRLRDAWNLLSQNVAESIFDLAGDGTPNPTPPSAPDSFSASPAAAGTIQVSAQYLPSIDGDNAADTFLIYLTSDGSTPDPTSMPTQTAPVLDADGIAALSVTFGPYAEATVIKVLVRMRRTGSPNLDSTNTTPVSTIATLLGPAAPTGIATLSTVAE